MLHLEVMRIREGKLRDIILRGYRPSDVEAMYELDLTCFEPPFRFSSRAMKQFAEAPGAVSVLAQSQDGLAGFCIVQREGPVGYVVTLDVAPDWRRRGLAMLLMTETEEKLLAHGASGMALHVFAGNTPAIRFYEKGGYLRAGVAKAFYARGLDALIYRKPLVQMPG